MKKIVREPQKLGRLLGDQGVHGPVCIEKTSPRHLCDLVRQSRCARAAVKPVIALPKRQPPEEICGNGRTYDQRIAHEIGSEIQGQTAHRKSLGDLCRRLLKASPPRCTLRRFDRDQGTIRDAISRACLKPLTCAPNPTRKCAPASKQSPGATSPPPPASAVHIGLVSAPSSRHGKATVPPDGRTHPSVRRRLLMNSSSIAKFIRATSSRRERSVCRCASPCTAIISVIGDPQIVK